MRLFFSSLTAQWDKLGVQWRLHLLIQISLAIFFICSLHWVVEKLDAQGVQDAENQAGEVADGLINGLNLLMLTGRISDPENRELLLHKTASGKNIKSLHLLRAEQVSAQYGPGLPHEHSDDVMVRQVMASGQPVYSRMFSPDGTPVLRAVIPFVASEDFRGTNCLSCHQVKAGSVNGVADISIDLSSHEQSVSVLKQWMWSGMLLFQLVLSVLISSFVSVLIKRHVSKPVNLLKSTMGEIHQSGDLYLRAGIEGQHPDIDRMAHTFNSLIGNLEFATEGIRLLATVVESSGEAILICDAELNIVFVNGAFERITGYTLQEVLGKSPRILKSGHQDAQFYRHMWQELNTSGAWQGEIYNRKKNGQIYPEWQSISVVRNSKGELSNYLSICMDITKRKEADAHIQRMANYDALTGLANRNLLNDRLSHALSSASRQHAKLALMYLDLDKFKDINDGFGHAVGDALLRIAAQRLTNCVREGDTVARQGGDEFILLLPDVDGYEGVTKIAQKLLEAVAAPYSIDGQEMFVSVSIGIGIYPEDGADMDSLLKNADAAMYTAKQEGRSCYRFFTPTMNENALRRITLQNRLRHALRNDELELYYQPQFNTQSQQITGMEALLRWHDAKEGFISPAEFIPVAEDSGLILSIGTWVLQRACQEAKTWHDRGYKITISVNVSGRQFKESAFDSLVAEALNNSGLAAQYLELELTEGVLLQHDEPLSRMMLKLKAMGIRLALDDFGTGYSSLSYIKRFPIDRIKIDQSFVRDVLQDAEDAAIVDAIIYIAHGLKMEVIAEGVETEAQLEFLSNHQCCDVQGYLVSRPVPKDQVFGVLDKFKTIKSD